jgi:glutaconate CoA-transferase subunit A
MAAALEIVRQRKKDITLVDDSKNDEADILIGAGCVKRWEGAYLSHGVPGLSRNYRRAVEQGVPHYLEVEESSNYAMSLRFLAGALNVPFLPTKSLLGSDLPKYNQKIKVMEDPYEGKPIALVPAAHPDAAIIHVQRADSMGNAQILGFLANDENKARAAKHTIITCEKIVSTDEIRKIPNLTAIPFYCVDAVVEVPYGSYWWSLTGYYTYDIMFSKDFVKENGTREGFLKWLDKWVYGCEDHQEFLGKVGWDRIKRVTEIERMCNKIPW